MFNLPVTSSTDSPNLGLRVLSSLTITFILFLDATSFFCAPSSLYNSSISLLIFSFCACIFDVLFLNASSLFDISFFKSLTFLADSSHFLLNLSCSLVEFAALIANAPRPAVSAAIPATNAPCGVRVITAFNAPIAEPDSIAIVANVFR